jgi:hypothetical protein
MPCELLKPIFAGDTIGVEIEVFQELMSVALFSKNGMPVGTRYLTLTDHCQFFPTIALCGNGSEMEVEIVWQNSIASPPLFSVVCLQALNFVALWYFLFILDKY